MVPFGLVHVCSPFLAVAGVLVDLELVRHALHLQHPLIAPNRGLDDLLLQKLLFVRDLDSLPGSEIELVVDFLALAVFVEVLWLVGNVSVALKLISHIIVGVVTAEASAILLDLRSLESELILQANLAQILKHCYNALAVTRLELVWRHV